MNLIANNWKEEDSAFNDNFYKRCTIVLKDIFYSACLWSVDLQFFNMYIWSCISSHHVEEEFLLLHKTQNKLS